MTSYIINTTSDKMDETSFKQRRTKKLKQKDNFEYNGKFTSKHLRITQELKEKNLKKSNHH
jgi:hypothetical protein